MNKPALLRKEEPEAMSPSDLWLALTQIPRPHRAVPFPRNVPGTMAPIGEVVMWPLSQEEQMTCNAAADKFTKELLKDPQRKDDANLGYHHTYANETAVQVLFRACRNPDDLKRPAFPSPKLMREQFTTDEIGVLFNQYCTVQAELGPIVATMSQEEMDAMVLRLQEGGSAFPFDSLSWEQQRTLVLSLACQVVSCWTAIFSAGLPLEVSDQVKTRLQQLSDEAEAARAQESDDEPADDEPADDAPADDAPADDVTVTE